MSTKKINEGYKPEIKKGYSPKSTIVSPDKKVDAGYQPPTQQSKPTPPKKD